MTKVKDIVAGNYCPDCKADCRHFVHEADACSFATFIGRLYSETVEDQSELEVHYEPVKQTVILTKMDKEFLTTFNETENRWIAPKKVIVNE